MSRALLAHPQEVPHKRHLVYCVHDMSVVCYQDWSYIAYVLRQLVATRIGVETPILVAANWRNTHTIYVYQVPFA
jgi:hypothetical protein